MPFCGGGGYWAGVYGWAIASGGLVASWLPCKQENNKVWSASGRARQREDTSCKRSESEKQQHRVASLLTLEEPLISANEHSLRRRARRRGGGATLGGGGGGAQLHLWQSTRGKINADQTLTGAFGSGDASVRGAAAASPAPLLNSCSSLMSRSLPLRLFLSSEICP